MNGHSMVCTEKAIEKIILYFWKFCLEMNKTFNLATSKYILNLNHEKTICYSQLYSGF